jgi:ring-1,2-phenylacetyl-CoA epoxidase subunit PaaE
VCGTEIKETEEVLDAIYHRNKTLVIDNTNYQDLIISKLVKETSDTVSVYFEPTNKDFYNFEAAQYVNIRVKLNGKICDRTFSLSSSPLDQFLRITVKLNGDVSHYFYNQAKVGDTIQSLLPVGDYVLKPSNNYLFVAGGSGITPIYSMIRTLLLSNTKSKITLFYSNKTTESTIFLQELDDLEKQFSNPLTIKHFVNGNRFNSSDFAEYAKVNTNFESYICGPLSLKVASKKYLEELNTDQSVAHTEDFVDGFVPMFGIRI